MNHLRSSLGPVDYKKTLDEYWQSICPRNGEDLSEKAKKKQNPEEQIWRYPVIRKRDKLKEKANVIERCAKEEDEMEVVRENMKLAADEIVKLASDNKET